MKWTRRLKSLLDPIPWISPVGQPHGICQLKWQSPSVLPLPLAQNAQMIKRDIDSLPELQAPLVGTPLPEWRPLKVVPNNRLKQRSSSLILIAQEMIQVSSNHQIDFDPHVEIGHFPQWTLQTTQIWRWVETGGSSCPDCCPSYSSFEIANSLGKSDP